MTRTTSQQFLNDRPDNMPMFVEIFFGLFGMMGMGWIYVGNFWVGGILFFTWLLLLTAAVLLVIFATAITLGLGVFSLCCLPFPALLWGTISGLFARDYAAKRGLTGNATNLIYAAVGGFVIIGVLVTTAFLLLGGLGMIMSLGS